MNRILRLPYLVVLASTFFSWGFQGHKDINRFAVFTLPPEMIGFYKKNIDYLVESSVNPDRRRYAVVDEAARHYIDLDHYGDSALDIMPKYWSAAVSKFTEDTLKAYGVVPWHIYRMYLQLKEAFLLQDTPRILRLSAELGHYIGDAHVPLHTTENYNGQLTGQDGIHGLWESRLVELFSSNFDYFTGRAEYIPDIQDAAWKAVGFSHALKDTVLLIERELAVEFGEKKFSFETKGRQTIKVYSEAYSKAYHERLNGMVERRLVDAIRVTGSLWYSAWVDAGQPELKNLLSFTPSEAQLSARRKEIESWKQRRVEARQHEEGP